MPNSAPYRYPGATPFSTDQKDIFFGRKGDTIALSQMIRREQLVLLHSKSGLGKSSLLNAGIIPTLKESGKMFPVPVRFSAWIPGRSDTPLSITKRTLDLEIGRRSFLNDLLPEDDTLWLKARNLYLEEGKTLLVIFDQFEELFTYPKHNLDEFLRELTELLNTGIPLRFRRKLDQADDLGLSEEEEDALYEDPQTHLLFAIRSDRLALLEGVKEYLPNFMRHSYELKALTRIDAQDAIVKPANCPGTFASPAFEFDPEVVVKLLDFLEDKDSCLVEGILLQMLCEHYERRLVIEQGLTLLTDIGDPAEVVQNYYQEKIRLLPEADMHRAQVLIEEGLVSKGKGMRMSLHESFIMNKYGVGEDLLTRLVDHRLLRAEPFHRGGYTYELSHDRLVPAVVRMRDKRLQVEQERERKRRMKEAERKEKELQEQLYKEAKAKRELEQRNKRIRLYARLMLGFGLVSLGVLIFAVIQWQETSQRKDEIEALNDSLETSGAKMQALQAANQRVLDAMDFYQGRLAVAVKDFFGESKYGIIDRDGNMLVDYNYSFISPYDENGFARATLEGRNLAALDLGSKLGRGKVEFLLDTQGKAYKLTRSRSELDSTFLALDLTGQDLSGGLRWLKDYPQLQIVILDGEDSKGGNWTWPKELMQLDSLYFLNCANRNLQRIRVSSNLKWGHLRILNLAANRLTAFPEQFKGLNDLVKLDLAANDLKSLPKDISNWTVLRHLDASYNELEKLPDRLPSGLNYLNLEHNQLRDFSEAFAALGKLEVLLLSDNELSEAGLEQVWQLESLKELYLESIGDFQNLPLGMGNLSRLEVLNLGNNGLEMLPLEFESLQKLKRLELSGNSFEEFPSELQALKRLTQLEMDNCSFESFPVGLAEMSNLTSLSLGRNGLTSLPPEIGQLKQLKVLNLAHNDLKTLPLEITQLESLEQLNLLGNDLNLSKLPPRVLRFLKNLRQLEIGRTKGDAAILKELKNKPPPTGPGQIGIFGNPALELINNLPSQGEEDE